MLIGLCTALVLRTLLRWRTAETPRPSAPQASPERTARAKAARKPDCGPE